jgi:hypothetical protein
MLPLGASAEQDPVTAIPNEGELRNEAQSMAASPAPSNRS